MPLCCKMKDPVSSQSILLQGGIDLRKWKTNDKELVNRNNSLEGWSTRADKGVSNYSEDDQSFRVDLDVVLYSRFTRLRIDQSATVAHERNSNKRLSHVT